MSYSSQDIIAALKAARKRQNRSQRSLSLLAGMPQSHISKIESGAVDPQISSLIELARALDLEVMLVPRKLVLAIQTVIRSGQEPQEEPRPAYSLDDDGDDDA